MSHQASVAIAAWLKGGVGKPQDHIPMDPSHIGPCVSGLHADAGGLYYSGLVSFIDALVGLNSGSFSWSTVKLYYSCFYAARSLLASNGIAIFYDGKKPYTLKLTLGAIPKKEDGVTHQVVWKVLARELANSPLLGDIDGSPAYAWMTSIREAANYKNCKFYDPFAPRHFSWIESAGVKLSLSQYINDRTFLYTFDPDHAAVAFPLECIRRAGLNLVRLGKSLDEADIQHLTTSAARIAIDDLIPGGA
jgi:hypothetical protein